MAVVSSIKRHPEVLFDTINNSVTTAPPILLVFGDKDCADFLSFSVDKIRDIRVPPLLYCRLRLPDSSSILDSQPLNLVDLVGSRKPFSCPVDNLPASERALVYWSVPELKYK